MPPRAPSKGPVPVASAAPMVALVLLLVAAPLPGAWLLGGTAAAQAGDAAEPGGDGSPPATPFTALPAPLLEVARGWLDQAGAATNAAVAKAEQAKADGLSEEKANQSIALLRARHLGAWDFLNESRLSLALSQLAQVPVEAVLVDFLASDAAGETNEDERNETQRRRAALALAREEGHASRLAMDTFFERLGRDDARLRSTRGLEYAMLAAGVALQGDGLLRAADDLTEQVNRSAVVDERVLRFALSVHVAPARYAAWAGDLLDLALEQDALPDAPPLPEGVKAALRENVTLRLADADRSSTTGLHSGRAKTLADQAADGSSVVLYAARYVAFQQARSSDALTFLEGRSQANAAQLKGALERALQQPELAPRYDGRLVDPGEAPGTEQLLADAGYLGLARTDARNHAIYTVLWEPGGQASTFGNLLGAWTALVGAEASADLLTEAAASPHVPAGDEPPWLMLGGVAVVVALGVLAVVFLRRPGAP